MDVLLILHLPIFTAGTHCLISVKLSVTDMRYWQVYMDFSTHTLQVGREAIALYDYTCGRGAVWKGRVVCVHPSLAGNCAKVYPWGRGWWSLRFSPRAGEVVRADEMLRGAKIVAPLFEFYFFWRQGLPARSGRGSPPYLALGIMNRQAVAPFTLACV